MFINSTAKSEKCKLSLKHLRMSEGTDMFQKIHACQRDTETNLKASQVAKPRAIGAAN